MSDKFHQYRPGEIAAAARVFSVTASPSSLRCVAVETGVVCCSFRSIENGRGRLGCELCASIRWWWKNRDWIWWLGQSDTSSEQALGGVLCQRRRATTKVMWIKSLNEFAGSRRWSKSGW